MVREGHDAPSGRRDDDRDAAADRRESAADARELAADARELAQDVRDLEQDAREVRIREAERPGDAAHLDRLTARQREVLGMIADGRSNQEISARLFITLNTVKTTIRALYAKIGVASRTQAVRWYEHGPRDG